MIKSHYKEYERFTTRMLCEKLEVDDVSTNRKKSITKLVFDLYRYGFLLRETINDVNYHWWTRKSYQLFKDNSPVSIKPMSNEDFDKEHDFWIKQVEARRLERERIRSAYR